jgi:hypothetical protein
MTFTADEGERSSSHYSHFNLRKTGPAIHWIEGWMSLSVGGLHATKKKLAYMRGWFFLLDSLWEKYRPTDTISIITVAVVPFHTRVITLLFINNTIIIIINCSTAHSWSLAAFFSFMILYIVGRTPWTEDQPDTRPLPTLRTTNKLHGLSPRANYTDRATAACRRSDCQLLRIKGATLSA